LPPASGPLCKALVGDPPKNTGVEKDGENTGEEKDEKFREAVKNIQQWVKRRNEAIHATAKVFRTHPPADFATILQSHRQDAIDGIKYLQAFDELDTAGRARMNKQPASYPNAFFPERRGKQPAANSR
jgi:hypothetical protein